MEYGSICHGCLSSDRRLSPIKEKSNISSFYARETLPQQFGHKPKNVRFCWECVRTVNKFEKFLVKFRKAQEVLAQPQGSKVLETLSSLKTITKCSYDYYWVYQKPNEYNKTSKKSKVEKSEFIALKGREEEFKEKFLSKKTVIGKEKKKYETLKLRNDSEQMVIYISDDDDQTNVNRSNNDIDNNKKDVVHKNDNVKDDKKDVGNDDDSDNVEDNSCEVIDDKKDVDYYDSDNVEDDSCEAIDDKKDVDYYDDSCEVIDDKKDVYYDDDSDNVEDDSSAVVDDKKNVDSDDLEDDSSEDIDDKNDLDYVDNSRKTISTPKKYTQKKQKHYSVIKSRGMYQDSIESYFTISQRGTQMEDLSEERRTNDGRKYPFNCAKCKIGWYNILDMQIHTKSNHQITQPATQDSSPPKSSFEATCNLCGKTHSHCFQKNKMHIVLAHKKIYACKYCSKSFRSAMLVAAHFRETHEMFICDYCNKKFNSKKGIKNHIRSMHVPIIPCPQCKITFKSRKRLNAHVTNVHTPGVRFKKQVRVGLARRVPYYYQYKEDKKSRLLHGSPLQYFFILFFTRFGDIQCCS